MQVRKNLAGLLVALVFFSLQFAPASTWGQTAGTADKPVRILVPNDPGGGGDIFARFLAEKLTTQFSRRVVVENRAGGSGLIAMNLTARAPADGTAIMVWSPSQVASAVLHKVDFDVIKDFAPIAGINSQPMALVVNTSVPVSTVKDLVAYAKSNPDKLAYASAGIGTNPYMVTEYFKSIAGFNALHVPFNGFAINEVLSGRIQMVFSSPGSLVGYVKAGKVRLLAVTSPTRMPDLPDWPTMAESGFPGFEWVTWFGLVGPAGIPQATASQMNQQVNKIILLPEVKANFAAAGAVAMAGGPEVLRDQINKDYTRFTKIAGDLKLTAE